MKLFGALILLFFLILLTLGYPNPESSWFGFLVNDNIVDQKLFWILRFPEVMVCIAAGSALAVAGLLLQTFLNNPLAGPSILGLTSGSHLLVALTTMVTAGWSSTLSDISVTGAAAIGALAFGLIILLISNFLKSKVSMLLVGMMLGTFVSAVTSIIVTKADPSAVKAFTLWSYGTLSQVEITDFIIILPVILMGILISTFLCKQLDALQLGENQAVYLGVNYNRTKWMILIVVSILTGVITSYCGPIAFVGLIVPNVVRMIYRTGKHRHLLAYSVLWGAIVLVLCDLIKLVLDEYVAIPINGLTSLMGAPIVVLLLLKQGKSA